METWALMGVSRGLGRAFTLEVSKTPAIDSSLKLHLSARKEDKLEELASQLSSQNIKSEISAWDFAQENSWDDILANLKKQNPIKIFYFAGGGPYGAFEKKNWKDHKWAFNLNLLFPSRLLNETLQWPSVKQWIFIGSSIAEQKGDAFAASYSSSKHGLLGLIRSLREESNRDIRLFSPGYMDTDMLPMNAKVRQLGEVWSPDEVASQLLNWSAQPASENFHFEGDSFKLPASQGVSRGK